MNSIWLGAVARQVQAFCLAEALRSEDKSSQAILQETNAPEAHKPREYRGLKLGSSSVFLL